MKVERTSFTPEQVARDIAASKAIASRRPFAYGAGNAPSKVETQCGHRYEYMTEKSVAGLAANFVIGL